MNREVYRWINMKLNITLDFNSLEEHKLSNILEKYVSHLGKSLRQEKKNGKEENSKRNSNRCSIKRKLNRESKN